MASEYEPYQNLANAIILLAARDYRKALKRLSVNPDSKTAAADMARLERFFFSQLYEALTDIDPKYLVGKLREEVGM
jgi:hypothetical protein